LILTLPLVSISTPVPEVHSFLTHCGPETRILVFGVFGFTSVKDRCKANLPFNARVDFTHLITQ
jgi:hypothetical protein